MWIETLIRLFIGCAEQVTPYAGVWIETPIDAETSSRRMSPPTRGCGLKRLTSPLVRLRQVTPYAGVWIETLIRLFIGCAEQVTPYAGVWIETAVCAVCGRIIIVTPYAGVWIETLIRLFIGCAEQSPPTRGCGLKHCCRCFDFCCKGHPLRGGVD